MMFADNTNMKWTEDALQRDVAVYLDHLEALRFLAWNHPPNEGNRSRRFGAKLKSHGMKAGQPDCEIWLNNGQSLFVELKTAKGSLGKSQKERHAILQGVGYPVYTIKATTPKNAVNQVEKILRQHGVAV